MNFMTNLLCEIRIRFDCPSRRGCQAKCDHRSSPPPCAIAASASLTSSSAIRAVIIGLRPRDARALNDRQADTAAAENRDGRSGANAGRVERRADTRGHAAADQADRLEGEVGIDPHGASRGDRRMLGEAADGAKLVNRAAVARQAGGAVRHRTVAERRKHLRAEEGLLLRTELAPAASRRSATITWSPTSRSLTLATDLLDDAPRLVAENDRQRSAHDPMDTGVVAVTETAGYDADRDLVRRSALRCRAP